MIAENNLMNMSEYQKIIFVNNIEEDTLPIDMETLSRDYPFAVFFTKQSSSENINNIWHQGIRYTRFIDVDKDASIIHIGDHTLRLGFNYYTGLLGIYDINTLESISIDTSKGITYKNLLEGGKNKSITELNNNIVIDAIDNKFSIYFIYKVSENTEDISKVSKDLNIYDKSGTSVNYPLTNNFHKISDYVDNQTSTEIYYKIEYQIDKDTSTDIVSNYLFKSLYSSDKSIELNNIRFKLNPTNFYVSNNGKILSNSINDFYQNDNKIVLDIFVEPSGDLSRINSTSDKEIIVRVSLDNNLDQYITFNETFSTITNSKASIMINSIIINDVNKTYYGNIKFELYYKYKNDNERSYNISQTYPISIHSNTTTDFIYYGFTNPNNLTVNNLKRISDKNVGIDVLWDWENDTELIDTGQTFYILIPSDRDIHPRYDMFESDDNLLNKTYLKADDDFTIIERNKIFNNHSEYGMYNVYKYSYNGLFKGKIQ